MISAMGFELSPDVEELRQRVANFVQNHCLPLEGDQSNYDEHENIEPSILVKLRDKAKLAGLWAPQMPIEQGGMGLSMTAQAVIYEEAAYSIFGPLAMNCAAPDDGNMRLLMMVGTEHQKQRLRLLRRHQSRAMRRPS